LADRATRKGDGTKMTGHDVDLTGAVWFKSTHSNTGGNCVEVCTGMPDVVAIRDSKDPTGPALTFAPDQWRTFVQGIKRGEFSL
jgi:hypothetical protein